MKIKIPYASTQIYNPVYFRIVLDKTFMNSKTFFDTGAYWVTYIDTLIKKIVFKNKNH